MSGTLIGNTRRRLVACARLCLAWLSDPLAFVAFAYRFFIYARSSLARVYKIPAPYGTGIMVHSSGIEPESAAPEATVLSIIL